MSKVEANHIDGLEDAIQQSIKSLIPIGTETVMVGYMQGVTLNMGNFESAKEALWVSAICPRAKASEMLTSLENTVQQRMNSIIATYKK